MSLQFNAKVHVKRLHLPRSPEVHNYIWKITQGMTHNNRQRKSGEISGKKKTTTKKTQVEQSCPQLKLWGTVDIHKYEAAV